MSENLFDTFGRTLPAPKSIKPSTEIIDDLELLEQYQQFRFEHVQSELFQKVRDAYIQRMYEVTKKKGKFTYVCIRCMKPIDSLKKMTLDEHSRLLYGVGCHGRIMEKQEARKLIKTGPLLQEAPPEQLVDTSCISCGRNITATKESLKECGVNPRCCFCCEYTMLKYKHLKCPLQVKHTEND